MVFGKKLCGVRAVWW